MIAAFFDLDGTLLPEPSLERRFLRYLAWRGDLHWWNWMRAVGRMIPLAARANWRWETRDGGEGEWSVLVANNKACLTGLPCWTLRAFCAWLERYPLALYPHARRRLEWHAEQGHQIFLVSGTLAPLAQAVARELPSATRVLATELACSRGNFTGRTVGPAMAGIEKARAVARIAAPHGIRLADCFAYGNSFSDRWMLARVGHPVAVNPSRALERLARANNWPIARWSLEESAVGGGPAMPPLGACAFEDSFVERLRGVAKRHGIAVTQLAASQEAAHARATELEGGSRKSAVC